MWPWRRRSQRTAQRSAASTPAPGVGAPTGDGPAGPPRSGTPARRRDEPAAWLGLPPIQRITPDEPRLNQPETFTGGLTAWRNPSYLAPLGHLVGAAEPAGVLHGAAAPVSDPMRADPESLGRSHADDPTPMPFAVPAADPGRPAPALQRQVTAAPAHPPAPFPPLAPPSRDRPVPVEPPPVSRLLTAPPPPVELHLPAVEGPAGAREIGHPALPDLAEPPETPPLGRDAAEPPETPTLGRDAAVLPDATPAAAQRYSPGNPDGPGSRPGPAAGIAGPPTSDGPGRGMPDLPVQRVPGDSARPHRRLGLGEPIVSPLLPPVNAPESVGAGDAALQRSPAAAPPLAHRPPAADGERDDGTGPVEGVTTATGDPAGLVGEVSVTRLAMGTGDSDADLGRSPVAPSTDTGIPAGSPPPIGRLPVVRTTGADTSPGATTPEPSTAPSPGPGGPPTVQMFVPTDVGTPAEGRVAPLIGPPPAPAGPGGEPTLADPPNQGNRAADAADGPALPVVSRVGASPTSTDTVPGRATGAAPVTIDTAPAPSPDTGPGGNSERGDSPDAAGTVAGRPDTVDLVGGYGEAPVDAVSGQPDGGRQPDTPLPLVVARLVGDRPARLLTAAGPDAPVPAGPIVQRVTWQQAGTPAPAAAARVVTPQSGWPGSSRLVEPPGAPGAAAADVHAVAPGQADAAGLFGAAGGGEPAPVQRWLGVLPASPARPASAGDRPLVAYPGGPNPPAAGPGRDPPSQVLQRAEPADAPPPADVPDPPAAAPPPPGDPPAVAGQPAAPGPTPGGEPEELLKKLYDPLLRRLKTELRLDRERHGVLGGPG